MNYAKLGLAITLLILFSNIAYAAELPVDVDFVKINGDEVDDGDTIKESIDRDQKLDIRVKITALENIDDVAVEATIFGDDHFILADRSETFDLDKDTRETVNLEIGIPNLVDADAYKLRIIIGDKNNNLKVFNYNLEIDEQRHSIEITDVILNPAYEVKAGSALLSIVRLENFGKFDEQGVKVTVSVPQLGISASDFIDEIEVDDETSSEELFLRIPSDAKTGAYDVVIDALYDDGFEKTTKTMKINIVGTSISVPAVPNVPTQAYSIPKQPDYLAPKPMSDRTLIGVAVETQDIMAGQGGAVYTVVLTNDGATTKSYTITISGIDGFGVYEVTPSSLIQVEGGKTESAYVYVAALEGAESASYPFAVQISSSGNMLKEIPLTVNVLEGLPEESTLSGALSKALAGVFILVIVGVIILAFVAYRGKIVGEEEEFTDINSPQTYY